MENFPLKIEALDGLARVTLNNPAAGNVMDLAMLEALAQAGAALHQMQPRAVLLDAAGKNFCVGGDIRSFAAAADRGAILAQLAGKLHEAVLAFATLPAPVIALVQGAAAGAGLSLAAGADLVLAGRSASFSMAYTGVGLSPDGGATAILPRLIGLRRTQELAYTNRRLTAEEALSWGLITQITEDDALAETGTGLARRIAEGPSLAFATIKRLLAQGAVTGLPAQLDEEAAGITQAARSADGGEGLAAFLARRKPAFIGR